MIFDRFKTIGIVCVLALAVTFCFASQPQNLEQAVSQLQSATWGEAQSAVNLIEGQIQLSYKDPALRAVIEGKMLEILNSSDATFVAKQHACKKLKSIGSVDSVNTLKSFLADEELSNMARYALEGIKDPAAADALVESLDSVSDNLKVGIINSLAQKQAGLASIMPFVESANEGVSLAAIYALGKIGGDDALEMLKGMHKTAEDAKYMAVADSLLEIAYDLRQNAQLKVSSDVYEFLYEDGQLEHVQTAALAGLFETRPEDSRKLLTKVLRESNQVFNEIAGSFLAESGDVEALTYLIKTWKKLSTSGQVAVLNAIAKTNMVAGHDIAVKSLNSKDQNVRIAAITALASIAETSDIEKLAEIAADSTPEEQIEARRALKLIAGEEFDAEMTKVLAEAQDDVKVELLESLTFRRYAPACDVAVNFIDSSNADLSKSSLNMLSELASADHAPSLVDLIKTGESARTRKSAEKTLADVCSRDTENCLPMILDEFENANTATKQALMSIATQTGDPKAFVLVKNSLNSAEPAIKYSAIKLLPKWEEEAVLSELFSIIEAGTDDKAKALALREYVNLVKKIELADQAKMAYLVKAIDACQTDREKTLVISAMGDIALVEALQMTTSYLDNAQTSTEAAIAIQNICDKIQRTNPAECIVSLRKVLEVVDADSLVFKKSQHLLSNLEKYNGRLLKEWIFEADAGDWKAENHCDISVEEGALKVIPTGGDPYITAEFNVPGGNLELHLLVKSEKESLPWEIFWGSDTKDIFAAPLWTTGFGIPAPSADYQLVVVPFTTEGNLTKMRIDTSFAGGTALIDSILIVKAEEKPAAPKPAFNPNASTKVLLIGTKLDHGFGTHMYLKECQLLAKCLKQVPGVDAIASFGWPEDESLLNEATCIANYSFPGAEVYLKGPQSEKFKEMMSKGVGLATLHWGTGIGDANDKELEAEFLSYSGGIFSFAFSGLEMAQVTVNQLDPDHPICNGWNNYDQLDEIYLRMKLLDDAKPLLKVTWDGKEEVVAWTYERPDGGRSYGNTLGHFHENFWITSYRRSLVNGILWAAKHEVPEAGAVCLIIPQDMVLETP